ncbi:MAG TPA: translation elongation factor Ts [Asticcacaulis sp.]|nr:translation elongation factor Ts [Asticcacaulis sp.]
MAEITASLVKDLREKSGAGMMDCKKALQENGGDLEAAMDWLRTKGLSKAAKKADRVAAEGLVAVASEANGVGMTAAAVEVNAETDFVSRNELFQKAARNAGQAGLKNDTVEGVAAAVSDELTNLIATIGENMVVRRMARHSVEQGVVASYIHNAIAPDLGRIAVLVAVESSGDQDALKDMGRKIAMHIAATSPLSLSSDDLDPAAVERERAVLTEKAKEEGKPEAMIAKIVDGQIAKFQREVVLLEQQFVMNPDQTVKQLVADTAKALGAPVAVTGFTRLALGEGVEKKVDDFAAEVASMTAGA